MTKFHGCSLFCKRRECVRVQRDRMRDYIIIKLGNRAVREMMEYKAPFEYKNVKEFVDALYKDEGEE